MVVSCLSCLYQGERERAGIGRETTLQSLLFTPKGTAALIDFIQEIRVATRRWLLQSPRESDEEDTWGWGSLQEAQERDGEEMGKWKNFHSLLCSFHLLFTLLEIFHYHFFRFLFSFCI